MPSPSERMAILNRLEKGEISPAEAERLLSTDETSTKAEKPMDVLELLERGEISADEAARRLSTKAATEELPREREAQPPKVEVIPNHFSTSRTWAWWLIPITAGTLITLLAGLWMAADARDGGLGLGFFCAWFPLAIGILLIVFGWLSQRGPWAHLKVDSRRRGGKVNVNVDLPVPLGVATTALRSVGRHIPGMEQEDVDKLLQAIKESGKKGENIHIQANDEDDNEIVDITIS
ncbi:MAG: hypothetical protein WD751_10715 [Anaerolineales bacterium]